MQWTGAVDQRVADAEVMMPGHRHVTLEYRCPFLREQAVLACEFSAFGAADGRHQGGVRRRFHPGRTQVGDTIKVQL